MNAEKCISHINISSISDTSWTAKSLGDRIYTIQKEKACSCPLKCFHCNVCTHMYTCTCMDNLLHCTACKHIHLLHMKLNRENVQLSTVEQTATNSEECAVSSSDAFDLLGITLNNHSSVTETALSTCKEILEIIPKVTNTSILRSTNKKLQAIKSLLQVNTNSESPQPVMNQTER